VVQLPSLRADVDPTNKRDVRALTIIDEVAEVTPEQWELLLAMSARPSASKLSTPREPPDERREHREQRADDGCYAVAQGSSCHVTPHSVEPQIICALCFPT
jgi:hypothetical protein